MNGQRRDKWSKTGQIKWSGKHIFSEIMALLIRRTARGYSFDNPTPDCVPRLFKSKNSANRALTARLQGEWKNEWHSGGWEEPYDYQVASPQKVEGRNREDMEVIELSLLDCSISELVNVQL